MRLYFAYGSNMDRGHMAKLCPRAEALGVARIDHHGFFIAAGGYGSIAPRRGAAVHGVLWRITARDRAALDGQRMIRRSGNRFADKIMRQINKLARDRTQNRYPPRIKSGAGFLLIARYEAVGDGLYQPAALPVHHGDKLLRALVYVANDARPGRPSARYRAALIAAACQWNLPADYVQALEGGMIAP
jgi:hypothetical protein